MFARVLLEDPDSIIYDDKWGDQQFLLWSATDAVCFGTLAERNLYVCSPQSYHLQMLKALQISPNGDINQQFKVNGEWVKLVVFRGDERIFKLSKEDKEYIETLNSGSPTAARLEFDLGGRYWLNNEVVSFWASKDSLTVDQITAPIIKAGKNPEKWMYEFISGGRKQYGHSTLLKYEELEGISLPKLSKEKEKELLQKQHLDPGAKRQLAQQSGALPGIDRARGFETPAQRKFATTVGDSLASTLVSKLLS